LVIMWQMLQVSMVQLDMLRVGGNDLSGIAGRGHMLDWEWAVSSEDPRGQVEVDEAVGDGVEGLCLGGNGEVPGSKWEWGKARVGPSQGSE